RSVELVEAKVGPDNPGLAVYLVGLTDAELAAGHLPEARRAATRALAIVRRADAGSLRLAEALRGEGDVLPAERRYPEAAERYEDALDVAEKLRGPTSPNVMWIARAAVEALIASHRTVRAVALAERAHAIAATHGPCCLAD